MKSNRIEASISPRFRFRAAPRRAAPRRAEPNRTEPNRTELNRTEPDRTGPDRTEPNRTEPNRTEPNRTEPNRTEPNRTGPDRTEPNRTEPNRTTPCALPRFSVRRFPALSRAPLFPRWAARRFSRAEPRAAFPALSRAPRSRAAAGSMDSKMENRLCRMKISREGEADIVGLAYNERCFGTIGWKKDRIDVSAEAAPHDSAPRARGRTKPHLGVGYHAWLQWVERIPWGSHMRHHRLSARLGQTIEACLARRACGALRPHPLPAAARRPPVL
jgi:hypothetical protein